MEQTVKEMLTSGANWLRLVKERPAELADLLESATLRRYAEELLAETYLHAVEQTEVETGLAETKFPADLPWTLDEILEQDLKS